MSNLATHLYKNEENDLELHVSVCHERYMQLDARLGKLETDVEQVKDQITKSNHSLKTTIITTSGTIIVSLIGTLGYIITKLP